MDNVIQRLQLLILACLLLLVSKITCAIPSGDQWFPNSNCTDNDNSNCAAIHFDAYCEPRVEENESGRNVSISRCFCNNQNKFYKVDDSCIFYADVGDTCDNSASVCSDDNAECAHDGYGYGVMRCACANQTRLVKHEGQIICAYELSTTVDSDCIDCVMNHGVCYSLNSDGLKDGCHCPATLSGDNCDVSHVNVTCEIDQMHVCYLPHPEVNFSDGAWLHVQNFGHRVSCVGALREDICGPGRYYLPLSLREVPRGLCYTQRNEYLGTVRYSNELVVQHDPLYSSKEDIAFGVFCSFKTSHDLNVLGIPINSISETEVGQDISPMLTFSIKTQLGESVSDSTTFRTGDMVFFHLFLDTSEGYSAMRVEFCTLSSSPKMPDPSAETILVIRNSCPAEGQTFFTEENIWSPDQGQPNELTTGLVQLVKLMQGNSLNLHCTIKLCITGSESLCSPVDCQQSRRKRDIELDEHSDFVSLHSQLTVVDTIADTDVNIMTVAAIIFSVLLIIIIIGFAVTLLCSRPYRSKRRNAVEDLPPQDDLEIESNNYIAGLRLSDPPPQVNESNV